MADRTPPAEAPARLLSLPLRAELDRLLSAPAEEREALLLESSNLAAVVPLMPPEELFFTLKELDPDSLPQVLAHARAEQVEFLLDLELWRKDRLRRERVLPWLERLAACGDDSLERWLRHLDPADLALILGHAARVHLADEESDPLQELSRSPFTIDGVYYVSATEEAEPLVRRVLLILREADPSRYTLLLESLLREADSEIEEHCFQERQRRLAVRGFPEWEEAMEVYARLEAAELPALPVRPASRGPAEEGPQVAPRYPVTTGGTAPEALEHSLRHLGTSAALEAFRADFAHLTNKLAVADGLDLDEPASFAVTLRKAANYISIGLETLSGPDAGAAAAILERHWAQHLFRLGWTRVREVRARARRLFDRGWPQGRKERLLFLDTPMPEILEGLLRPHPVWYSAENEPAPYRLFRSLEEVRRADWMVGKAAFLGSFLMAVVDLRLKDLREALTEIDTDNLKGTTVFLTALLNAALGRTFRFAPVSRVDVPSGLALLWQRDAPPRRIKDEFHDAALEWSRTVAGVSEQEEGHLREFIRDCFTLLEEEFGHLAAEEIPDPRFTRGLWIA